MQTAPAKDTPLSEPVKPKRKSASQSERLKKRMARLPPPELVTYSIEDSNGRIVGMGLARMVRQADGQWHLDPVE